MSSQLHETGPVVNQDNDSVVVVIPKISVNTVKRMLGLITPERGMIIGAVAGCLLFARTYKTFYPSNDWVVRDIGVRTLRTHLLAFINPTSYGVIIGGVVGLFCNSLAQ